MCFSAEASFGSAVILGGIGIAALKSCKSNAYYCLAAIPFLFAMQQFAEGVVWVHFNKYPLDKPILQMAIDAFLIFAFLVWPVWIPLSLALVEKTPWRRHVIVGVLILGIGLSSLNLMYALRETAAVKVVNHSLQYLGQAPEQMFLYPFIILFPCFISSIRSISIFGMLVLAGYVVANYFYLHNFISVWCFFAALVSLIILKIVKDNQTQESIAA